ncbi:MAG: ergothioneine biosynthesis protein EgtC [Gammaproteobacteria bacterium]|nr:ergothioneine biosynthesis protein EgtC [Gammaproteobacteria bacterium]
MCRLAAYLGPPVLLQRFLLEPSHSLYEQSWAPRELKFARLNADGFGLGWYSADATPATYVNQMPIWSDINLPGLARTLSNPLWMAMVRSATSPYRTGSANTQPFTHDGVLFMHNGYVEDFDHSLRGRIRHFLSTDIEAGIGGNTDSEYLFALLRQLLTSDDELTLEGAIRAALELIDEWLDDRKALLNLLLTDGERLYATRHALNADCPSLYFTTDDESFDEGAQIIASERLTEGEFWQPVPQHHLLILDLDQPPELIRL